MIDPKKRLKEILKSLCHNTMGNPPYRIADAINQILKEFVHKDSLPSFDEIEHLVTNIDGEDKFHRAHNITKVIRKLIKGKN